MSKNSIRERITRSEERISEMQSSLNEIKDNCKTIIANIEKLEKHVNEEISGINDRMSKQDETMISFKITQKVLIFLAGVLTTGFTGLLFDNLRRSLL
jgi:predicted  nucleic acid-binding Zn-ribbon protein